MNAQRKIKIPQSTSNFWMNLFAVVLFFVFVVWGRCHDPRWGTVSLVTDALLVMAIPLWLYDLSVARVYQRPSVGFLTRPGPENRQRLVTKLIGLFGTYLIILLAYYLNPVFEASSKAAQFYNHFFIFLNSLAPWIVGVSFVYFWEIDRRQKDPYDGYWHMGCFLTGKLKKVNRVVLQEYAKGWFIKAFFLPFLFASLVGYIDQLSLFRWHDTRIFIVSYDHLLNLFYATDVVYGVLGYILTVRALDTHMQSTEPTLLGWIVCLACYNPLFGIKFLPYEDDFQWFQWFGLDRVPYYLCGGLIIGLTLVLALATVAIGYRMSNLTYRGIITTGPYRFTKHPAYLCKVVSWWLISLPFLSVDGTMAAFIHTFNLSIISGIYYLRAKTEENHLSNYPEYVAYANWINEHGIFSFIGRLCPALRYSEDECKKWKSVVWFKKS